MSLLESKANAVAKELIDSQGVEDTVAFDPTVLLALISIIIQLFMMLQNCKKKPEEALTTITSPSILEMWTLRKKVREVLNDESMEKMYGRQLVNALVSIGKSFTEEEVRKLYTEVSTHA
jgi:hypothetical protein